jgi:hypothetical protein
MSRYNDFLPKPDRDPVVEDAVPPIDQRIKASVQQLQALAAREPALAEFLAVADVWTSTLYRLSALEAFEAVQLQRAGR